MLQGTCISVLIACLGSLNEKLARVCTAGVPLSVCMKYFIKVRT